MENTKRRRSASSIFLTNDFIIPAIATAILLALSFLPIFQIILLEVFKVYKPISSTLGIGLSQFVFPVYAFISITALYQFYNAENYWAKIVSNIIAILFLYPLLMITIRLFGYDSTWIFFAAALAYGIILIGLAIVKLNNRKEIPS